MMGQHTRSEALFYYFRLEDQVPENHLLRLIDQHISFDFVRERLKESYSETGRPSIDPELLLRILLIGYLYGITSERKLVEELRMHLAWRWFTGLGFDQEIPHHSTFSKNRHGRFQESKLFAQLFGEIVKQCVEVGLVRGDHLSVDGSFVEANAAKESRIPREQLGEAAEVHQTVRQYLADLEQQNPVEEPAHEQDQVSTTDPDSTYATKGGTPAFRRVARTGTAVGGRRYHLWQWRVSAMVVGAGHHSLYAHAGQCLAEEQPLLWSRAIYLSARKQQLPLPGRPATQLRGPKSAEPRLYLYRDPQALWGVLPESAMHQWRVPLSCHPHP